MTTECETGSIEQTLRDVIEALSIERAVEITGRSAHYLRAVSHPDKRELLSCRDAVLLDAAYASVFGNRPLVDNLRMQVDHLLSQEVGCQIALAGATIEAVRESGQAHAALIASLAPDATDATRNTAIREVVEAVNANKRVLPMLRAMMKRKAQAP